MSPKRSEDDDRLVEDIYDALDDVKSAMAGLLAPIKREVPIGQVIQSDQARQRAPGGVILSRDGEPVAVATCAPVGTTPLNSTLS